MLGTNIRSKCSINTNRDTDTFVGFKCTNGDISIHFPLGFNLSDDNKSLKKDILLLMSILAKNTQKKDSELLNKLNKYNEIDFPVQAYIQIIKDFYSNGYYHEQETKYVAAKNGKINWNRTIKTQNAYIQGTDVYYLDFVVKKNEVNENQLITLIHEYCVYDSFDKMGWLFTKDMPPKPRIKFNKKLFINVLMKKLQITFNDKRKRLFTNMIAIINFLGDDGTKKDYKYGTYRFEYVWQSMIDKVYGIKNKQEYFPTTEWRIIGEEPRENSVLEPDTIMPYNHNVYILDAKYYKYGVTGRKGDLPNSSDIEKQITYGEYIAETDKFRRIHGTDMKVYNVFLMPFNAMSSHVRYSYIGTAISKWKTNTKEYEYIYGVLVDVKHVMCKSLSTSDTEVIELAQLLEANEIQLD